MRKTTTVRITEDTRETLRQLAAEMGIDMQEALARAVGNLHCELILEETNAAYAALGAEERRELADEHRAWDSTLADGLER